MSTAEEKIPNTPRRDERFWEYVPSEFVIFDVETTGLESRTDRILEIGATLFTKEDYLKTGEVTTFQCFIKQDKPIPPEITKINKITDEMVSDGISEYDALTGFFEFVSDRRLLAYNSKFDRSFIVAAAKRSKYLLEIDTFEVEDILFEAKEYFEHLPNRKLSTIAKNTGFTLTGEAHRAVHDCAMALHVYISIRQLEYKKIFGDLEAILGLNKSEPIKEQEDSALPASPKKIDSQTYETSTAEELISSPIQKKSNSSQKNLFMYGGIFITALIAILAFTNHAKKSEYESSVKKQCAQTAKQDSEQSKKKNKSNTLNKQNSSEVIYEKSLADCLAYYGVKP